MCWGGALQLLLQIRKYFSRRRWANRRPISGSVSAAVIVIGFTLAGCIYDNGPCIPSGCGGPTRLFSVETELAPIRDAYNYPDVLERYNDARSDMDRVAIRNEFVFERIYAIDVNYSVYEEAVTRESQDEGFAAAVANAALTGTAALIPVAQTTRILAGIAAGLTTADQAYNKQYLLNKTVQILETQMRADRADVYTHIVAAARTSSAAYPLGMAMSDLEQYYRAGTLSAAFISLSQGAASNADVSKQIADSIKPGAATVAAVQAGIITNVNAPLAPIVPVPTGPKSIGLSLSAKDIRMVQTKLCMPPTGKLDAETLSRISIFLKISPTLTQLDSRTWVHLQEGLRLPEGQTTVDCSKFSQ